MIEEHDPHVNGAGGISKGRREIGASTALPGRRRKRGSGTRREFGVRVPDSG